MDKQFIPCEQALELKELGFDEKCFGCYLDDEFLNIEETKSQEHYHGQACSAPLWQQAFDWFREKYSMSSFIKTHYEYQKSYSYHIDCEYQGNIFKDMYDSYEEAQLECLKKLIEIVKENGNKK